MTSNFSRSQAEADLKETAADASYHSSGDVLNTAAPDSKYAHGAMERSGSIDGNTNLPSTETNFSGAYAIGHTSTAGTAEAYDNKFTTPATQTVGTGSRTVQSLPEQVTDLGSTVQTHKTTHIITEAVAPTTTTTYIPPKSNATYTTGSAGQAYTTTTSSAAATAGETRHLSSGISTQDSHATTSAGHAHHGIIGNNTTIRPADDTHIQLNAASGAAVGTSAMGIPHSTASTSAAKHGQSTTHDAASDVDHTAQPKKEGMMSKIKHAFHK